MEPAISDRAFPRKDAPRAAAIGYRDIDTLADIVAKAVSKGPYLMGEQFTAADVVVGSGIRWGTMFKLIPERPEFKPYVERIAARPASLRADAKDKELAGK
jgi:glutathione S-transferase